MALSLMIACKNDDDDDGGGGGGSDDSSGIRDCNNNFVSIPTNGVFSDPKNDVPQGFIDLKSMEIVVSGSTVSIELTMEDLPNMLTFDHTELPVDETNYRWSVTFDMDSDGVLSENDLLYSVSYFKQNRAESSRMLLATTQGSLWKYEADLSTTTTRAAAVTKTGNMLKAAAVQPPTGIAASTMLNRMVCFETFFSEKDGEFFQDLYPN